MTQATAAIDFADPAFAGLPPLIPTRRMAALVSVHPRTLRRMVKTGRLAPPVLVGGGSRWPWRAVLAALEK